MRTQCRVHAAEPSQSVLWWSSQSCPTCVCRTRVCLENSSAPSPTTLVGCDGLTSLATSSTRALRITTAGNTLLAQFLSRIMTSFIWPQKQIHSVILEKVPPSPGNKRTGHCGSWKYLPLLFYNLQNFKNAWIHGTCNGCHYEIVLKVNISFIWHMLE